MTCSNSTHCQTGLPVSVVARWEDCDCKGTTELYLDNVVTGPSQHSSHAGTADLGGASEAPRNLIGADHEQQLEGVNGEPLVSCIVIFLDTERYIEEAIESVFAQTYESWELLLVDDGSTDGSTDIARRYAQRHPGKVRYLEHPGHQNRGMSATRNLGISHAKGDYIAFLDADDVWLPRKLEEQVAILGSHPEVGMVYGAKQYWYSWTGDPRDARRDFVASLGIQTDSLFEPPALLSLLYPLGIASLPHTSSLLLRREVVERLGGYEDRFKGMYEDQAFLVKVYLKETVYVASECWNRYRQHPASWFAVAHRSGEARSAWLALLNWLEEYLSEQGVEDPEVWKLLRGYQVFARARIHVQKREWKQAMGWALMLVRRHPWVFFRRLFDKVRWKILHMGTLQGVALKYDAWLVRELSPAPKRHQASIGARDGRFVAKFKSLARRQDL
jgi:glycosyltransferase involved in cell wall biosynthesis